VRDNLDYPGILRDLFPGHPARRFLCRSVYRNESEPAEKVVTFGLRSGVSRAMRHIGITVRFRSHQHKGWRMGVRTSDRKCISLCNPIESLSKRA
jgi:hypothetical protein